MADNVTLNSGSGGDTIAADDDGTAKHQYVKLEFGGDGTFTKVATANPLPVTAASLPLPTSAATAALQTTGNSILTTIDADTGNIATAASAIQTAVQIMDDWDESDRAKVNPIVGQAGVAAGAGTVGTTTQRMTLASNDPAVALLGTIDTDTGAISTAAAAIQAAVEGTLTVDGSASTQPVSGTVTANLSATDNAVLDSILAQVGGIQSTSNNSTTPLASAATFTGTGEQNAHPDVMVSVFADNAGTLFFDFSVDGTNWTTFPTAGFAVAASTHTIHEAVKGPRYFRVRLTDGGGGQTTLRLFTYFGVFRALNSPLNTELSEDSDASTTKAVLFAQVNGTGNFVGVQASASGILKTTGGGTEYTEDDAAPANADGRTIALIRQDTPAGLTTADGDILMQRGTDYGAAFCQILDSSGNFIDTFGGGTQYTEDAAAAADPVGNTPIFVRQDTPATLTTADGDNVAGRATNYGAQFVQIVTSSGSFVDSFSGSGGTSEVDDADFTAATTAGTPAMGVYESTPTNVTDGDLGIAGITITRELKTSDASAAALLTTIDADTGNIATAAAAIQAAAEIMDDWDESDRAKVNPIAGQAGVAAGAGAVGATTQRVTLASDDPGVVLLDSSATLLGTIDADTSTLAAAVVTEDAAAAADPVGTTLVLVRRDTLSASEVSADGDNVAAKAASTGAQYVELTAGTTKLGDATNGLLVNLGANNDVSVTGTVTVDLGANNDVTVTSGNITADTELPTAAALADDTANPTVPAVGAFAMCWDGATWDRVPGTSADGLTVNLGSNNDVTVTSGTITSAGAAAHDAAVSGNPTRIAGRALTADYTAVATGDTADLISTTLGKQIVMPYAIPGATWSYAAASGGITNTTGVTAKAAGTGSERQYITHVSVVNGHATVGTDVQIRDGASGTVLWRSYAVAAGGGVSEKFDPPLRGSAATLVEIANGTTGSATYFNLQGYTAAE